MSEHGYDVRVIDLAGNTYWNGVSEKKPDTTSPVIVTFARENPWIPDAMEIKRVNAWYERYIGPEDGGPLYIYRLEGIED